MAITSEGVREIFKGLENGDGAAFFERVADDVDWTVMGAHPLAGHYPSKRAFVEGTFAKLSQVLPKGALLHVVDLIVKGDQAVVELHSLATANSYVTTSWLRILLASSGTIHWAVQGSVLRLPVSNPRPCCL
jgi:ketosteroid isomerase-like protein